MGNIYVSPIGGLANRLRMIISSKILANYLNYNHFIINWIDNDNCVASKAISGNIDSDIQYDYEPLF
jgi:hypothetical protein